VSAAVAHKLTNQHCKPRKDGEAPLSREQAEIFMQDLHGDWVIDDTGREISRTCSFRNYYQTMAFVNALAWVAHGEDHHPDIEAGYNRCHVRYSTHAIGGLSENDFICAAKIDALLPDAE
jgi:4a-hydroxytetrahydrobiopterin dehydratase